MRLKCERCKVKGGRLLVKLNVVFDVFWSFLNRFPIAFSCYSSLLHGPTDFFPYCFLFFVLLFGLFLFCMLCLLSSSLCFLFLFVFVFFSRPFTCCGAESEAWWFLVLLVFSFVLFESFCVSFASSLS